MGVGVGLVYSVMPAMIVGHTPSDRTGSAVGANSVLRLVGGSAGGAVVAAVLAATAAGGALLAGVVALVLLPRGRPGADADEQAGFEIVDTHPPAA